MGKTHLRSFILSAIVCAIALVAFALLNTGKEFSPGWSDPVKIQESGGAPSLLAYNGELWLAFNRRGDEGTEIAIIRSKDGLGWSSPYTIVKKTAGDHISPMNPRWLKRPDGDIWLVWSSGTGTSGDYMGIVYYAWLKEDGTFTAPSEIHSFDGRFYSFWSITNTPRGGLALLEDHYPPVSATIQGRKIQGTVFSNCVVQSTDETLEWTQPFLLSQTDFASCISALLDDQGTIWAVYEESDPMEGTYFRTSDNGIAWSEPHMIPITSARVFYQRHNHQYVILSITDYSSVSMMSSPDGTEWSGPIPVITLGKAYDLDVTESDDGTLWAIIDGGSCFYVTHYSDEQYMGDSQEMRDFRTKNGVLACGIAILVGSAWLFVRKRFSA